MIKIRLETVSQEGKCFLSAGAAKEAEVTELLCGARCSSELSTAKLSKCRWLECEGHWRGSDSVSLQGDITHTCTSLLSRSMHSAAH